MARGTCPRCRNHGRAPSRSPAVPASRQLQVEHGEARRRSPTRLRALGAPAVESRPHHERAMTGPPLGSKLTRLGVKRGPTSLLDRTVNSSLSPGGRSHMLREGRPVMAWIIFAAIAVPVLGVLVWVILDDSLVRVPTPGASACCSYEVHRPTTTLEPGVHWVPPTAPTDGLSRSPALELGAPAAGDAWPTTDSDDPARAEWSDAVRPPLGDRTVVTVGLHRPLPSRCDDDPRQIHTRFGPEGGSGREPPVTRRADARAMRSADRPVRGSMTSSAPLLDHGGRAVGGDVRRPRPVGARRHDVQPRRPRPRTGRRRHPGPPCGPASSCNARRPRRRCAWPGPASMPSSAR